SEGDEYSSWRRVRQTSPHKEHLPRPATVRGSSDADSKPKQPDWTREEDAALEEAVIHDKNRFRDTALILAPQSKSECRNRFRKISGRDDQVKNWHKQTEGDVTSKTNGANSSKQSESSFGKSDSQSSRQQASKRGWWIKEEDELLLEKYEKGYRWNMIADFIPGCTPQDARERYELLVQPSSCDDKRSDGPEDEVDEEIQKKLLPNSDYNDDGEARHQNVSDTETNNSMEREDENQISENKSLDGGCNLELWSPKEKLILQKVVKEKVLTFHEISEKYFAEAHTRRSCEIQWRELNGLDIDENAVVRAWTPNEDSTLIEMFKKGNSWREIAFVIPCCTREDVSKRYKTELEDWKESEKQIILQKRKECGKDWSKIASALPGRTLYEVRYFCRVHEKNAAGPPS
ncbi:MAG: hypothetical protein SGARI_002706, partial [Bacillariaceae sp.]